MTYVQRAAMAAGDVYTAADQNDSAANDDHLHNAVLGPIPPESTGGMVRQWVSKTGLADNVATNIFTVTTVNEAGNTDGGVYLCDFEGIVIHGEGSASEHAVQSAPAFRFVRAMGGDGAGANSVMAGGGTSNASSGAEKTIVSAAATIVETSEYVQTVQFQVDIGGTAITTAKVMGMVTVTYYGFLTAPVVASA